MKTRIKNSLKKQIRKQATLLFMTKLPVMTKLMSKLTSKLPMTNPSPAGLFKSVSLTSNGRMFLMASALFSSMALPSLAHANTAITVDLAGTTATKHEIAVLQVLSEICPAMLNQQERGQFYNAYAHELRALMPTVSNPKEAVKYLSTQQDYRVVLTSMRDWTMGFSVEDNLALCRELANANYS